MAYNPYGGNPYGMPPSYNPYAAGPPGMGLGPPPGMSSAPGMAPPPGVQQPPSATQANRPSGLPPSFQPPPNLPNINFNAPVIRLGGASSLPARPNTVPSGPGRRDPETPLSAGGGGGGPMHGGGGGGNNDFRHDSRGGNGGGLEPARASMREAMSSQTPATNDEKLRTIFVHKVPTAGVGGGAQAVATLERLLGIVGKLRRWDASESQLSGHEGELFGFAQYEDPDSLAAAIALLKDVQVPLKKQEPGKAGGDGKGGGDDNNKGDGDGKGDSDGDHEHEGDADADADPDADPYKGIDKVPLQVAVDPVSLQYIEAHQESQSDEAAAAAQARQAAARTELQAAVRSLFYPPQSETQGANGGDVKMVDGEGTAGGGDGVEVVNIPLAQDDELSDIPTEFREMVASEIASFREQSTRRDMERLRKEQELEEQERRRVGEQERRLAGGGGDEEASHSHSNGNGNGIPVGPRANGTSSGLRRTVDFVSGDRRVESDDDDADTDASDEERYRREVKKQAAEEDKQYQEAERKWVNRERQRAAALEREKERERAEGENGVRRRTEQLERERTWDDEREAGRKNALYYRDHAAWLRKRAHERGDEEARDSADRRAEKAELRRQQAELETAQGMADSFLAEHGEAMRGVEATSRPAAAAAAPPASSPAPAPAAAATPARFTISFGAAAQRAQAQRGGATRRTVAEVEGLLDDEEQEASTKKRTLVPIAFEPMSASAGMTDEELNRAVRALAAEIPTDKAGLWAWAVPWDKLDEAVLRDKLRPFVEKKVVEYLGVQEQFLVEVVEEHLRKHGRPEALVEELQEALDEAAEDLVKKLWRMVIFFSECEKRGLPA